MDSSRLGSGVLPARRASAAMWSGVSFARSVTSSPNATGRSSAPAQAVKQTFAASGSQWMFHSVRRRGVARAPVAAAHQHPATEQSRQLGLAQHGDGQVGHRAEGHERDLARVRPGLVDEEVDGVSLG